MTPNQTKEIKILSFSSSPIPPTFSESTIVENIENVQHMISQLGSSHLFQNDTFDADAFVRSVHDLRHVMHFLVSHSSGNSHLVLSQKLMHSSMTILQTEFHHILSTNDHSLHSHSILNPTHASADVMSHLNLIADCMICCGYRRECVKIYEAIRKSAVDKQLHRLGVDTWRSSHVHKMTKDALDRLITNWLAVIKTAVTTIFKAERVLCDHVFATSEATREPCFLAITQIEALNLIKLPQLIAKANNSPDAIFRLIQLYDALSDVWPDIDSMFSSAITSQSLTSLADAIRALLLRFEGSIQRDTSRTPVAGGGIHPLTRSVMNYISLLADYDETLSDILTDHPPSGSKEILESCFETAVSPHLARLILVLLCKLDTKTHQYKDVSLAYLFLANNLQLVVDRVHTTRLRCLLGDDWVLSHAKKVVQYAANYQATAWSRVTSSLPGSDAAEMTKEGAKECFGKFNAAFEEACGKQRAWVIPDGKLRDEIKLSIARMIVPSYQQFYDSYFDLQNSQVLSPDELGKYLSEMFRFGL